MFFQITFNNLFGYRSSSRAAMPPNSTITDTTISGLSAGAKALNQAWSVLTSFPFFIAFFR